jgi:hypothetical protein
MKLSEAPIEEEAPSSADSTDSPALATPSTSENTTVEPDSWSSMVNTPLFMMFPKDKMDMPADPMLQPWSVEGIVPQMGDAALYRKSAKGNKKKVGAAPNAQGKHGVYAYDSVPMPTPVGIVPNTPYNLSTMSAMGMSPEAQLRAVQMFVNGYAPPMPQAQPRGGRWKEKPTGAGTPPKSAASASGKSTSGLKSASSSGLPSGVINRENETDPELLKDIPAWLKALRLHKYAPCFEGLSWQEAVVLDESQLEAKGVATVGARKRFLRLFETVRKSQGMMEDTNTTTTTTVEAEVEPVVVEHVHVPTAVAVC